ncbi:MAG: hypothetical protein K6E74_04925 [Bacilli bacterium]|nr:hypothetical protein [Bacilli bacterium]
MNLKNLIESGYKILNGEIITEPHLYLKQGHLVLGIPIRGDGWSCEYGGYSLSANFKCAESLLLLMDVLGVADTIELKGKAVRIAVRDQNEPITIIGNIVYDKWFNFEDFIVTNNEELENISEETDNLIDNSEETNVVFYPEELTTNTEENIDTIDDEKNSIDSEEIIVEDVE